MKKADAIKKRNDYVERAKNKLANLDPSRPNLDSGEETAFVRIIKVIKGIDYLLEQKKAEIPEEEVIIPKTKGDENSDSTTGEETKEPTGTEEKTDEQLKAEWTKASDDFLAAQEGKDGLAPADFPETMVKLITALGGDPNKANAELDKYVGLKLVLDTEKQLYTLQG